MRFWLFRLGLLGFAALVGLLFAEVTLRLSGVSYPRVTQRHDFRGTAYRPNVQWAQSDEGYAQIRTNSVGFRDQDWTIAKPDGTRRIAVLGDSYVDAVQVEEPARFTEQIGVALAPCRAGGGQSLQVMNFGQSGYGTAQELMTYRHDVSTYSPDLVILAFLSHNDLRNNSQRLQGDPGRPCFHLVDDQLTFDDSFRTSSFHVQPWWKRLFNAGRDHLRLLQLANETRQSLSGRAELARRQQVASALLEDTPDDAEIGL